MNVCLSLPPRSFPLSLASSMFPRRREPAGTPWLPRASPAKHPHFELLKDRLIQEADRGRLRDALSTLDLMADLRAPADLVSYTVLLNACIRSRDLPHGRAVHRRLDDSGLVPDAVAFNSLLTLYSKCGDWETAGAIFRGMGERRDLVSWSTMISSWANAGMRSRAVALFVAMLEEGIRPNEFCFSSVLSACSNPEYLYFGLMVLGLLLKMGYFGGAGVCVGCALIDLFARNRELGTARKVFDGMLERNAVAWTLMITRCAQDGLVKEAIDLFLKMEQGGFRPDEFTLSSVISACTDHGASFQLGPQLHSRVIRSGLAEDACVGCSLVNMYAKAASTQDSMEDSRKVFDRMVEHNVMSWTAFISGLVRRRHDDEAIDNFCRMIHGSVRPNHITFASILKACANVADASAGEQVHGLVVKSGVAYVNCVGNSMVSMYAKSDRMEAARKAFQDLLHKNIPISCGAAVDGNVEKENNSDSDHGEGGEYYFSTPGREGTDDSENIVGASAFTFASLLSGAATVGAVSRGRQLHAWLLKLGFSSDRSVDNALISMYSRCGDIDDARRVFEEMTCRKKNVVSWTSMIVALAEHGCAEEALSMFGEMVRRRGAVDVERPNGVTYVGVLSACSRAGLVEQGRKHFGSMSSEHGIVPRMEHYACMVDLLGRVGLLREAVDFIHAMPFKASALVWRALLGACRIHGDVALGERAAEHILELEPRDPAAHVLLSNIYAATGRWQNVAEVRSRMKGNQLVKEAGLSWIEIDGRIHEFHAGTVDLSRQ